MRGSLTQRPNGYWYVQLRIKDVDGRWGTKVIATGVRSGAGAAKAPPEAEAAYRRALARYELGGNRTPPRSGARFTVAEWMDFWLDERRARNLDGATIRQYESIVRLYIVGAPEAPLLGGVALASLTERGIRGWLRTLQGLPNRHARHPRPLSATTVRAAYSVFRSALDLAVPEHLLTNPFARVPRPKARDYQPVWLEEDQLGRLLAAARGTRLEAMWVLQAATGMRIGELLALTWRDVGLERGTVRVRDAKTPAGDRILSVADEEGGGAVVEALRAHHRRQAEERLKAGPEWHATGLAFTTRTGGPLSRSNVEQRDWKTLLEAAGLPWMRPHDLRHTAGTLALARGVPLKAVQQMLGHASEAFLLRKYAHALGADRERAGAAMASLLGDLRSPGNAGQPQSSGAGGAAAPAGSGRWPRSIRP